MIQLNRVFALLKAGAAWLARSRWWPSLGLFVLFFAIHASQLNILRVGRYVPGTGREVGAIAFALTRTGRFADPYVIPTGPTAHLPPVSPALSAAILAGFGNTAGAGYAHWLLAVLSGSTLAAILPSAARRLGLGRPAGFLGGLGVCFLSVEWPSHGESLAAIALVLMAVAFVRRWTSGRVTWRGSLWLGLGMGAAYHVQPALLPVSLGCMAFEGWWSRSPRKWASLAVVAAGIALACAPWVGRNFAVFNTFVFIRSNLGLELRINTRALPPPSRRWTPTRSSSTAIPGRRSKRRSGSATWAKSSTCGGRAAKP